MTDFRTLENLPGIVYDEDDTTTIYAEDINALNTAVNALETKTESLNILTANQTYYVNASTGSDSNNGLSSGAPFATIQKAINVTASLTLAGYAVFINVASGTYSNFTLKSVAGGTVYITGDSSTPSNVVINGGGNNILGSAILGTYIIDGFKFTGGDTALLAYGNNLIVNFKNFYIADGYATQIVSAQQAVIVTSGTNRVDDSAARHIYAYIGGIIEINDQTLTLGGTTSFSTAFAGSTSLGLIRRSGSVSFSGSASGKRYEAEFNSIMNVNAGTTFFPGNSAGTTATGAQYG